MSREQREVDEAKVRVAREMARKRKGPDAPLGPQIRDRKVCLSDFGILRRHFGR